MPDKIIVTNESALRTKYKASGLAAIRKAVNALIAADKKRELHSVYLPLDSAPAMKKAGGKAVADPASPKQNKDAVDVICKKYAPDYLMILGAADVVPHQDLKNPVFSPGDDDDKIAWGDIPYACEAPYSTKPENFVGPTRVLGRLPDLAGGADPAYLTGLLATAANYTQRKPSDYAAYFGVTAAVWQKSTAMSLEKLFGSGTNLQIVPPKTANWPSPVLSRLSHFINCHGAPSDFHFFGQKTKNDFPESLDASRLPGKISEGTVVAAECCYGAELYDPVATAGQAGICSTYLKEKAYGFFGSTTIAYGPAEGNDLADLICQFFLKRVVGGASLGRAALEARQQFVQESGQMDPTELKTLAQFNLLGDPSLTPVVAPAPHFAMAAAGGIERGARRRGLMDRGMWLAANSPTVQTTVKTQAGPALLKELMKMASQAGMSAPKTFGFAMRQPASQRKSLTRAMIYKSPVPDSCHVVIGRIGGKDARVQTVKVLVANVSGGKCTSVREFFGKRAPDHRG